MAANITLKCGTGVASITYAWVNSSGTRTPPSGTDTTYDSVDMDIFEKSCQVFLFKRGRRGLCA